MNQTLLPSGFTNIKNLGNRLATVNEAAWLKRGDKRVLELFWQMAQRVPAYKDFLKKNHVDYKKIKTIADFKHIPLVDKDNYLRAYPRSMLCWDGVFDKKSWVISTTSGSTGKPYYFPRQDSQDWQYAIMAELYLRHNFQIHQKSTLYIVAFPMGAWIGGVFTYEALKIVAEKGNYPLSIITPGIHKAEILNAVKELGQDFDQIIIGAYAPFLKDFLDDGIRAGIDWHKYCLGFVFSAEAFSEQFRDYVIKKTGVQNEYNFSLNHYGTVDLGTMSHETPLAIYLRRMALTKPWLYDSLFGDTTKLPTLTQYIPELFYFEEENGNLYCSAYSGLPLVRYNLKDRGNVYTLQSVEDRFKGHRLDLKEAARAAGAGPVFWNLPFVQVYERSDLSVSFYAFQIYPETIKRILQDDSVEELLTGKFTMEVVYDDNGQQKLFVNIELKADTEESSRLHKHVTMLLVEGLLKESSEYRETHKMYGVKVYPEVVFWPYEDAVYFRAGAKQKWVKK